MGPFDDASMVSLRFLRSLLFILFPLLHLKSSLVVRVIVLVRVAVVMDLVEMNVQIGPLPKQLIDGGVADVRSVEIERLQFGDRLQIGQAAIGEGDVN